MRRINFLLSLCAGLSACAVFDRNPGRQAVTENELAYRANLIRAADPRSFDVVINLAGRRQPERTQTPVTLDDLRESARFEATKYCILVFGGSDVDWVIDPETQDWALRENGDRRSLSGRCTVR